MMKTIAQFAKEVALSPERVRILCRENRIAGVTRVGRQWLIQDDAVLPERTPGRRPKDQTGVLPLDYRSIKTVRQEAFLAACPTAEENIALASPFAKAKIRIIKW